MKHNKNPVIAFLTASFTNIDDCIRQGKKTGGTASVVRSWAACLANGFETHVFVMYQSERPGPKETKYLNGVQFHWMREPLRTTTNWLRRKGLIGLCKPLSLLWQLQMVYRLLRAKIQPDIIYCMRPTYLVSGWLWSRLTGAKLVWRLFGCYGVYDSWFGEGGWLSRLKNIGGLLAYRIPVDLLITTNDGTRGDEIARWAGFRMEHHRFWLNGVNKSLHVTDFGAISFKQSIGLASDSSMILMLGRLCHFKRVDRVIDAMPDILKDVPEARLVLVGGGELRGELENRVRALGLDGKVVFVGPVSHEEIWKYLNASDLFVIVNICSNLSETLIEAMTAGCCILTADVGGTTQVAIDGVNSIVLDEASPSSIGKASVQLLKHPEQRKRLAEGAYQYAMENFQTWDERMQMEVDELKRLLTDG
ncbi:MAG: glycosyltransferase family 4 protein [Desulfobacteraceae bacterium]|nr:glycosyltransferase family 4 protein [Desulfobacteraceae bacterium]